MKIYKGIIKEETLFNNDEALFIGKHDDPIAEIFEEDFQGKQVTVRYWISEKRKTKNELQESTLKKILGVVDANYGEHYSEYTGYLWTEEDLNIGGHDLLSELRFFVGKYVYLEVEIHE